MFNARSFIVALLLASATQPVVAGTLVQFHIFFGATNYVGDLDVELHDQDKPVTVNNFLKLVEIGAYEGSFFHRGIPGSVIQGGGILSINAFDTNVLAPPYSNLAPVFNFGPITNEFGVGKFYSNTNGTIAMAKTSDPNSATSEFFFNLADNSGGGSQFDNTSNSGGFVVFGQIVRDTNNILGVMRSLQPGFGMVDLTRIYGTNGVTPLFAALPNTLIGTNAPPYNQLIYFDVSILGVSVKSAPGGARQITWNSIRAVTNNVEFTTNFPATWQVLVATNGTGGPITVTDSSTNSTRRFYRIHVLY